jgi:hypothetical protein
MENVEFSASQISGDSPDVPWRELQGGAGSLRVKTNHFRTGRLQVGPKAIVFADVTDSMHDRIIGGLDDSQQLILEAT